MQTTADSLRDLVKIGKPYDLRIANTEIKEACWKLCARIHDISIGHPFYEATWIDSFIGFELAYAHGRLESIDGSVIHGDKQEDALFLVTRDDSNSYGIDYLNQKLECRPFMFRYLTSEESNKALDTKT